jgi:hypothetical protein
MTNTPTRLAAIRARAVNIGGNYFNDVEFLLDLLDSDSVRTAEHNLLVKENRALLARVEALQGQIDNHVSDLHYIKECVDGKRRVESIVHVIQNTIDAAITAGPGGA